MIPLCYKRKFTIAQAPNDSCQRFSRDHLRPLSPTEIHKRAIKISVHFQQVTPEVKNTAQNTGWLNGQRSNGLSLTDRLRSGYHRFWYEASQAVRWSWGPFHESSKGPLTDLTPTQQQRTEELARISFALREIPSS